MNREQYHDDCEQYRSDRPLDKIQRPVHAAHRASQLHFHNSTKHHPENYGNDWKIKSPKYKPERSEPGGDRAVRGAIA